MIEFLNVQKNELIEKQSKLVEKQGEFLNKTASKVILNLSVSKERLSLLSTVFESVKSFIVDKPKQYFETITDSVKGFVFTGNNQNSFKYTSPDSEEMALEMENLKQQYDLAISEANVISQKFNLLQNEMEKIKNSGVIVRQPS